MGSAPFSLSAADWKKLGIGAVLAATGGLVAFGTAELMPTLKDHIASDLGLLIYTALAALLPVLLNIARKFLGDTTKLVAFLAVGLVLASGSMAYAGPAEAFGAGAITAPILNNLFSDPLLMAGMLIGLLLLVSKVLKIDLTPMILPLITSLLKPPVVNPVQVTLVSADKKTEGPVE
jgi:hypothetical protein